MATVTLEQVRTDFVRTTDQTLEERIAALDHQRLEALRDLGQVIRDLDSLVARLIESGLQDTPDGAALLTDIRARRVACLSTMRQAMPQEAWFWTERWQEAEREADADLAAGRVRDFANDDEFFAYLDSLTGENAHPSG